MTKPRTTPGNLSATPVQPRAFRTLERILAATEELLEERLFEQVAIADIAERAGVSVGTIYTRFADKSALLPGAWSEASKASIVASASSNCRVATR